MNIGSLKENNHEEAFHDCLRVKKYEGKTIIKTRTMNENNHENNHETTFSSQNNHEQRVT